MDRLFLYSAISSFRAEYSQLDHNYDTLLFVLVWFTISILVSNMLALIIKTSIVAYIKIERSVLEKRKT